MNDKAKMANEYERLKSAETGEYKCKLCSFQADVSKFEETHTNQFSNYRCPNCGNTEVNKV